MVQIRPGDLVAVRRDGVYFMFAILTEQILFGAHWSYVFHGARDTLPPERDECAGTGFNAFVDYLLPKREDRLVRIRRGNDFSALRGPELLQQKPVKGQVNYRIWRWQNNEREKAE